MDSQRPGVPFLKAGPPGTVSPQEHIAIESQKERGRATRARTVALPLTHLRESVLTHSLLKHMTLIEGGEVKVEEEIRPLESRMKSAGGYYGALDVDDGLGPNGGPVLEDEVVPAPAGSEEKDTSEDLPRDNPKENGEGPKVIRTPREPTQKEREVHESLHLPHAE